MKTGIWRLLIIAVLLAGPLLVLAGFGSYYLWERGWSLAVWFPMMGLFFLGNYLAWYWQRSRSLLPTPEVELGLHYTERDRRAAALIEAKARSAVKDHSEQLTSQEFYIQSARELADELAQFYNPKAADAIDRLTIPEMLAAIELAAEDLAMMVEKYFPGGHLLTIRDFKNAAQLTAYYQTGSNLYWGVMAIFDPIGTGLKYATSQAGGNLPMRMLQRHLVGWFYEAFLTRLGKYLIEVNSGRLRVGARRYRELRDQMQLVESGGGDENLPKEKSESADEVARVTMTLIGQVKSGKSSLINALLGEERAKTSSVPCTQGIQRYEAQTSGICTKLTLFDSQGYGHEGPRNDQIENTFQVAKESDVILLVLHARNPGRQADLQMLQRLNEWFAARPELKAPPVLAVMTHVDLLSPAMDWSPPYDWRKGNRPKESNIREAMEAMRQQLGEHLDGAAPVCTASGKLYGLDQDLIPALVVQLDEARGVAFVRTVKAEADRDRISRIVEQAWALGNEAAGTVWGFLRNAQSKR